MPKSNDYLNAIAKHVKILNEEMGHVQIELTSVKTDIKWIKKFIGYMVVIMSGIFVAVGAGAVKYLFLK